MQNSEISKQNVGDDPTDRPKVTTVITRIRQGSSDSCDSEIALTVDSPHGGNYSQSIQLIFSNNNYTISSSAHRTFPSSRTILYKISGRAYSVPNQDFIKVRVDNEEDSNVEHSYDDNCPTS